MNELSEIRNSEHPRDSASCLLGEVEGAAGTATGALAEQGGMRIVTGAYRRGLASFSAFIFSLLLSLCALSTVTQAQDEEVELPPTPHKESLPPESYNFAMKLPLGTDCSIRITKKGGKSGENGKSDSNLPMKLERSFRNGISASKEITSKGGDLTFYFVEGLCAYDSPTQGANVVRRLEGHDNSNLAIYDFPELTWASPELRQARIEVENGKPAVRVYKLPAENLTLEVDASSGFPVRFSEGGVEWTYAYKTSDSPILLPESLQKPLLQITGASKGKPEK